MEPAFSQVSAWSYAFAAVLHTLFGLYLGTAWRRGRRGAFLLAVVAASALWAAANWAFSLSGWVWLFQLGNLLDVLRMAAWFGFLVAMLLFCGVRSRVENSNPPESFKGLPITLVSAAITSMSFMGFGGLVENIINAIF